MKNPLIWAALIIIVTLTGVGIFCIDGIHYLRRPVSARVRYETTFIPIQYWRFGRLPEGGMRTCQIEIDRDGYRHGDPWLEYQRPYAFGFIRVTERFRLYSPDPLDPPRKTKTVPSRPGTMP